MRHKTQVQVDERPQHKASHTEPHVSLNTPHEILENIRLCPEAGTLRVAATVVHSENHCLKILVPPLLHRHRHLSYRPQALHAPHQVTDDGLFGFIFSFLSSQAHLQILTFLISCHDDILTSGVSPRTRLPSQVQFVLTFNSQWASFYQRAH